MADIAVMADPVGQLAAAIIQHPAPVLVHTGFAIGAVGSRAEPEIVIKFPGRCFERISAEGTGEIMMPCRQTHFSGLHLANAAVSHQFAGETKMVLRTLPAAGLPDTTVAAQNVHHSSTLAETVGKRFFTVAILAGFGRRNNGNSVPVIRQTQRDRIDILARQQLTKIMIHSTIRIAVSFINNGAGVFKMLLVQVADGDDLAIRFREKTLHVIGALPADTDAAHDNFSAG